MPSSWRRSKIDRVIVLTMPTRATTTLMPSSTLTAPIRMSKTVPTASPMKLPDRTSTPL